MFKKHLILLILLMLSLLAGCYDSPGGSAGKIVPPEDQASPFGGKWEIVGVLGGDENSVDMPEQWNGDSVQFVEGAVAFGGNVWDQLSYKIKRVSAADYLAAQYRLLSDFFSDETRKVDVVTIYASGNYLGEFMKIGEEDMIFFVQDSELLLKKVSDQVDEMLGTAIENQQGKNGKGDDESSGILLGLREPGEDGYVYRTLWIAANRQEIRPVLESQKLFFPRTSGFWELQVQDILLYGKKESVLSARNLTSKPLETNGTEEGEEGEEEEEVYLVEPTLKVVNYIGNDYVSIEESAVGANRLRMLPVDKLSSRTVIKISDLLGENGLSSFISLREQEIEALEDRRVRFVDRDDSGENFGLKRKNGRWALVGRINYQSNEAPVSVDFDLNIAPPAALVFYDTLTLSWYKIKDRVPDAMDAFTSPTKDIALVKTRNKISVYRIGFAQLAEKPLAEIDLPEGASIIMAEWGTGSYVESWERAFLSYGAQPISEDSIRMY